MYMKITIAYALFLTACSPAQQTTTTGPNPEVRTASGRVRGVTEGGVAIFRGIPFAAPPVGANRWRPPQPVKSWDTVRDATKFCADCPQWENNLFIGALSGQHIARLVIDSNNKVVGEERLLSSEGQRFRDITQGIDNALYAITDAGRLYKIDKK